MNRNLHQLDAGAGSPADRAAAAWLVQREDGSLTGSEQEALERWLAADPDHREAFDRMERLWRTLGSAESATPPARRPWPRIAALAMAATLLLTLALGSLQRTTGEHHYHTDRELLTVTLEDGSELTLDAHTRLSVSLGPDERNVELFAGKARFVVSPDPSRPFKVEAGPVRARVLGTVFDVDRRADDGVSVFVLEGKVEVLTATEGRQPLSHLGTAGDAITWHRDRSTERGTVQDLEQARGWAEGRLVFRGEAASIALEQVNRYERKPLRLPPDIAPGTPVYGAFQAGEGVAFLNALADGASR